MNGPVLMALIAVARKQCGACEADAPKVERKLWEARERCLDAVVAVCQKRPHLGIAADAEADVRSALIELTLGRSRPSRSADRRARLICIAESTRGIAVATDRLATPEGRLLAAAHYLALGAAAHAGGDLRRASECVRLARVFVTRDRNATLGLHRRVVRRARLQ